MPFNFADWTRRPSRFWSHLGKTEVSAESEQFRVGSNVLGNLPRRMLVFESMEHAVISAATGGGATSTSTCLVARAMAGYLFCTRGSASHGFCPGTLCFE